MDWLRDWWDGISLEYLIGAAIASVLLVGVYTCAMMPPQPVVDRFATHQRVEHSQCAGYDAKGNCTFWHHWTTIEPQWVLVDPDGRECAVLPSTYTEVSRGEDRKCYQLFGWHHGVWDREFPMTARGWGR
jgi:hypothetical protein